MSNFINNLYELNNSCIKNRKPPTKKKSDTIFQMSSTITSGLQFRPSDWFGFKELQISGVNP